MNHLLASACALLASTRLGTVVVVVLIHACRVLIFGIFFANAKKRRLFFWHVSKFDLSSTFVILSDLFPVGYSVDLHVDQFIT